jgi:hypothetical protein
MKTILLSIALLVAIYLAIINSDLNRGKKEISSVQPVQSPLQIKLPTLRSLFYQDVSLSIRLHGIDLITSRLFEPYYHITNRTIELYFGLISEQSARQLIQLTLPAATFRKPVYSTLANTYSTKNKALKQNYVADLEKYTADSIAYYADRQARIVTFSRQVDSSLAPYRKYLTHSTDLSTIVSVAENVFRYSEIDSAQNYFIIYSDGHDSRQRTIKKINAKVCTILVNANGNEKTNIDNIIDYKFAAPAQAVAFTLHNHLTK